MVLAEVQAWNQYWSKITENETLPSPKRRREKPHIVDDALDSENWNVITIYLDILVPLEQAIATLQSHPSSPKGSHILEILPTFECLLHQFEEFKE